MAHRGTEVTEAQREGEEGEGEGEEEEGKGEEGDEEGKGEEGEEEEGEEREDEYPFIILTKPSTNLSMPKFMRRPKCRFMATK